MVVVDVGCRRFVGFGRWGGAKFVLGMEVAYDIERESYKRGKQCFILD